MPGLVSRNDQHASRTRQKSGDTGSSTAAGANRHPSIESPVILRAPENETTGSHDFLERHSPSWLASLVTHLVLLLSLSLLSVNVQSVRNRIVMQIPMATDESRHDQELETFQILEPPEPDVESELDVEEVALEIESDPLVPTTSVHEMPAMVDPIESLAMILSTPSPPAYLLPAKPAVQSEAGSDGEGEQGQTGSGGKPGTGTDGELGMRAVRRMQFSTPEMNYAINNGLFWLARHQRTGWGLVLRASWWRVWRALSQPRKQNRRASRRDRLGVASLPRCRSFAGPWRVPANGCHGDQLPDPKHCKKRKPLAS